ncbi:hypothetical protein [Halalkalibacter nanhaiisediminis]|uniref:Uncharacterized protein n=1 Tax=Halalkalibacter nanhaiisediminis TaxID=688079 RepID=A0A562Q8A3_9BACI|nr:hypothetical protein [Halalkalibacter nanhaiisediminis]TWI52924.1 hypothetical protein IQ10_03531 [Halalkalibacter nanhaiisediminis]
MKFLRLIDRMLVKIEEHILSYSIIIIPIMVVGNVINRANYGQKLVFLSRN